MYKEDTEDTGYIFVGDKIEKSEEDKEKKIKLAKGIAVAVAGVSTIGAVTFGVSRLVKSSGNDKRDEPTPDTSPEPDNPKDPGDDPVKREKDDESSVEGNLDELGHGINGVKVIL